MNATPGGSRLAFTDVSLTRLSLGGDDVLRAKLSDIGSAFDQHCQSIENRASDAKAQVLKQLNGAGGGRQVLKRQLQGLKSSLLNLGQKEFFSEGEGVNTGPHAWACGDHPAMGMTEGY